jgi:hypothetical protein
LSTQLATLHLGMGMSRGGRRTGELIDVMARNHVDQGGAYYSRKESRRGWEMDIALFAAVTESGGRYARRLINRDSIFVHCITFVSPFNPLDCLV